MSKYTFTFKKDDVFVEFFTEDKDVVERQFQIWVSSADDYVNNRQPSPALESAESTVQQEEVVNIEQQTDNPQEIVQPEEASIKPEEVEIKEPVEESIQPEEPQVFEQASTLLKTINTMQEEITVETAEVEQPSDEFDKVLEDTIESNTFEPSKVDDKIFLNLITSKNTTDKFNYLIITAYYLSEFEKLERFSLKQINAKLMQNLSEVIDHATLQEAINQNFIELVPDLTGTSEVAEYRLTRAGEEFFAKI